jgi:tetratricopeptide (TPR) repeat protein
LSPRKDKLLESAQKFIAKGQVDRAIRDYEQIVALDKGDIRHRQRLAELLVRVNRKEEAIAEYEAIGKLYSENAFYLKAIAVYKQIQKLDATNIKTTLTLAGLNEKQGLTGNALTEYGIAANYYLKAGLLPDALGVIERMLSADPENLNTHLKFAETYFTAGLHDKAYREFTQLALLLQKRGDDSAFNRICERVMSLYPGRRDFRLDVLAVQVEEGDAHGVIPVLRDVVAEEKNNLRAWQLLAEAYLKVGDNEGRRSVLYDAAAHFPRELSVVEALIRLVIAEGDSDSAQELLKIHEGLFAANDAIDNLQALQASLLEIAARDSSAPQESGNDSEPAAASEESAEAISVFEPLEQDADFPAQEHTESHSEASEEILLPSLHVATVIPCPEMDWEEEIDLSLLDETSIGLQPDEDRSAASNAAEEEGADISEQGGTIDFTTTDGDEVEALLGEDEPSIVQSEEVADQSELLHEKEVLQEPDETTEVEFEIGNEDVSKHWLAHEPNYPESEGSGTAFPEQIAGFADLTREPLTDPATMSVGMQVLEEDELLELGADIFSESAAEILLHDRQSRFDPSDQFTEFKKGIDQQLDKDDTETHYNLGIAYKEMGLYDDAIAEFRAAASGSSRKIDCLTLEGICHRDNGDFEKADEILSGARSLAGLTAEERLSLTYELAYLYEIVGRKEDALHLYREVRSVSPDFRDAAEKISLLLGNDGLPQEDDLDLLELDVEAVD